MAKVIDLHGKKVVDATYRMAVRITAQDVADGDRKEPDACAAALACIRDLEAVSAQVHLSRVYVEFPKRWLRFKTPKELREQIIKFDQGVAKFRPDTYVLSPLSHSERVTGKAQNPRSGDRKPKKTRARPHHIDNVRYASNFRHRVE